LDNNCGFPCRSCNLWVDREKLDWFFFHENFNLTIKNRSISSYYDWAENPVVTTIKTTGYSISNITFPAVTICSQGYIEDMLFATILSGYGNFLKSKSMNGSEVFPYPPIQMAEIYGKSFSPNVNTS